MIDIEDYKYIYNKNIKSVTQIWLIVLFFIIIGIVFINKNFKYEKYYSNIGEYQDKNLNLYVLITDLDKITKNNKIMIDDEEFAYKIKEISKENIFLNNNYYKEVKISFDNDKIQENEVINIKIVIEKTPILEYVFKTVWR